MKTTEEMLAIKQAYADGKTIEYKSKFWNDDSHWDVTFTPCWNWDFYDYRIKPGQKS